MQQQKKKFENEQIEMNYLYIALITVTLPIRGSVSLQLDEPSPLEDNAGATVKGHSMMSLIIELEIKCLESIHLGREKLGLGVEV